MSEDDELRAIDISLYNALFLIWNNTEFDTKISINRNDIMKLAKIGSANTYTKSLKKLHDKKYIIYKPSYNALIGSVVTILRFDEGLNTDLSDNLSSEVLEEVEQPKKTTRKKPTPKAPSEDSDSPKEYKVFMAAYFKWFEGKGIVPKIDKTQGKSLKEIIAHFKSVVTAKAKQNNILYNESELSEKMLEAWNYVLDNWDSIEPYLRKKTKLSQISSEIQNILNQIRNGQPAKQQSGTKQATGAGVDMQQAFNIIDAMYPSSPNGDGNP